MRRVRLSCAKRTSLAGDPSPTGKSSGQRPPPINITVATDGLHQSPTGNKLKKLTSPPCIPRISALKSASKSLLADAAARTMTGFSRARSLESTLPMPETPKGRQGEDSDPIFCSLFKDRLRPAPPSDHSRHKMQLLREVSFSALCLEYEYVSDPGSEHALDLASSQWFSLFLALHATWSCGHSNVLANTRSGDRPCQLCQGWGADHETRTRIPWLTGGELSH